MVIAFDRWKGAGFGEGDKPDFWVTEREAFGTATDVPFTCADRATVDAVYAAAIAAGDQVTLGTSIRGAP